MNPEAQMYYMQYLQAIQSSGQQPFPMCMPPRPKAPPEHFRMDSVSSPDWDQVREEEGDEEEEGMTFNEDGSAVL
jgi:hypothetical protein